MLAFPLRSGPEYIDSLRGRNLRVFFLGERVNEPVDHPVIRPSVNAVARTYDLANEDPDLATACSSPIGKGVNRFLCKHNVTRFPVELARLAQDLAGELVATLPSERDFQSPETGPVLKRLLRGRSLGDAEARERGGCGSSKT